MKFLACLILNLLLLVPSKTTADESTLLIALFVGGDVGKATTLATSPPKASCPNEQRFALADLCPRFLSKTVADEENTICLCQIGGKPKEHIGWFKKGCKSWLKKQHCLEKAKLDSNDGLDPVLSARDPKVKNVNYAFIGHWTSAHESVSYLSSSILPMLKKYDLNFEIDNTACRGVDNPYRIRAFF